MAKDYDNSNRLALWNPRDERRSGYYKGYGEIGGSKIYDAVLIVNESDKPNAPFAHLWWRTDKCPDGDALCTPLWNNDGKIGGRIEGWWLNVWKNESGPPLTITFKQMEQQASKSRKPDPVGVPAPPPDDEIPF